MLCHFRGREGGAGRSECVVPLADQPIDDSCTLWGLGAWAAQHVDPVKSCDQVSSPLAAGSIPITGGMIRSVGAGRARC